MVLWWLLGGKPTNSKAPRVGRGASEEGGIEMMWKIIEMLIHLPEAIVAVLLIGYTLRARKGRHRK